MTKKILIAEDEWELRNLLKLILEDYDLTIFEAGDGEEALKAAKENLPDLILLDNNMPGLSGYEVIQHLKAITELKSIPIIMLTGKRFDEEMQQIIKMDVKEFLPKPYEEEKIVAAVKKTLGELPKKVAEAAVPIPTPTILEIPVIPVEFPVEQPQSRYPSVDKTVVLRPEELPSALELPTEVPETSVVAAPIEIPIPEVTIPEVPREALPETQQVPYAEIPSAIPITPTPEITIPTPLAPSPEIAIPEVSFEVPIPPVAPSPEVSVEAPPTVIPSPEITLPEVTIEPSETKFYCVMKSSVRDFLLSLSPLRAVLQEQGLRTTRASEQISSPIFVIVWGNETNVEDIEHLNTFIELFGDLPVVLIDYKTFYDKLQSIISTGMEVVEINPSAFRKM